MDAFKNLFNSKLSAARDDNLSRYIPFANALTPSVVTTKNGDYLSTWQLQGLPFEGLSDHDIETRMDALNVFVRSLSNGKYAFWVHRVRRELMDRLESPPNGFAHSLMEKYYGQLGESGMMVTELYITILYRPFPTAAARAIRRPGTSLEDIRQEELAAIEVMNGVDTQISSSLKQYGVDRLEDYEENRVVYSGQREFYAYLINGSWQKVPAKQVPLYRQLPTSRVLWGDQIMETRDHYGSIYSAFVDIKDYSDYSEPGILNGMLGLPCEYVETHSFSPMTTLSALEALRRQRNQLISSQDKAVSQIDAIEEAMDQVQSGNFSLGEYHYTMQVKGLNPDVVRQARAMAIDQLSGAGFLGISIDLIVDHAYAAQFPGNFRHRPRTAKLSSRNFTGLCALHNFGAGKRDGNPWGEAVTILSSPAQQPVYFNFHNTPLEDDSTGKKALGNTQIIGQSGAGKTVIALFFLMNLLKYGTQIVFFDKDRGAEIAIRGIGGKYLSMERNKPTGFNPFKMEATSDNVQFWNDLIVFCTLMNDADHSPKELAQITHAVNAVAMAPVEMRGFEMVLQNLPPGSGNDLSDRLLKWTRGNQYGWALDCEDDELVFEEGRPYGFDYTEILDDPNTCPAIMMYLMFRVEKLIDGRRFAFFMDEYWKALSVKYFEDFAKNKQKTIRKQNGFGVYMTQSPSDTLQSDIARVLIEQTATFIFLPNPAADRGDYIEGFKLTESEFEVVRSLGENSRMFLIKQGHTVSIAKLDLTGFNDELRVISGSTDNVERLERLRMRLGDDPADWLQPFTNGENE
ncbi:VirB4 family type IV secretion/conjugal transfer ATPase [Delftia sp. GW456-R20]|uniref:VirB4 family type IV secretion/conjugal transfer ATPase n=1 Tax=Delftia sp. GW456-R20 TaxID=1827145 RepID=UPI0009EF1ADB|nr:VirB4 family type IV secretion/conjugal transfer ATPase [Delftia sp. GW456-R20]